MALAFTACATDDAPKTDTPSQLRFSLTIADSEAGTRATSLPGDPGDPESPFVKPRHLYAIAILTYSDSKTYLTYRHVDTSQPGDWGDIHISESGDANGVLAGDSISTYNKGSLSLRSVDKTATTVTVGTFYALATLAPINLSGIDVTQEDVATDVTTAITSAGGVENFIKSLTFDLPALEALKADGIESYNAFLRSAYNTPSTGYAIAATDQDVKTVTATLYHTATRLDLQWDTEALASSSYSGSVLNGSPVESIVITALPTTGIHAFTPLNAAPTGATYSETITTNPSTQYMGREVRYVPSIQYYPLTINETPWTSDALKEKSTIPDASWTPLTKAPWVRINLK